MSAELASIEYPDLVAKSHRVLRQATLADRDRDIRGSSGAGGLGGKWNYDDRRQGALVEHIVLDDYDWPRPPLDGTGGGPKVSEVDIAASGHLRGSVLRSEQARVLVQAGVRQF